VELGITFVGFHFRGSDVAMPKSLQGMVERGLRILAGTRREARHQKQQ
jgi:hypothetical protein